MTSNSTTGSSLAPSLDKTLQDLATTDVLLTAMDFDGTMSPLVNRPQEARALPENAEAFNKLSQLPKTYTALISGRSLASLKDAASPLPQTLLIGSHGAEKQFGNEENLDTNARVQEPLSDVINILQKISKAHPHTHVESKPLGAVLHTREASVDVGENALSQARQDLKPLNVYIKEGKNVLEVSLVHANKGEGLQALQEETKATGILFAGDDVTDEDGFKVLHPPNVSVKVGPETTAAQYSVNSVNDIATILNCVLQVRQSL